MAASETFANQPQTTVVSGGTTAPAGGTTETWTVSSSSSFPGASTGVTQFHVADTATGKTSEIILVTNVSGTTWSVTRGAEGTTPVAHSSGFSIVQVVTAGFLASPVFSGAVSTGGLTGATSASRYAGATTSGAPGSGTFAVGDYVVDQTGKIWICTTAGSPGTWTQAAAALDSTASDIQPAGVQTAGSVGKAADAGHIHPWQPWQFLPESYGAKGDGQVIADAVMTNGSAVLTSASNPFVPGDAGKHIIVNQGTAASNTAPLITTIASYQSAGQVTLAATCTSAVATAPAIWGTDDTAAINSAVSAAYSYATGALGNYSAEIVLRNRIYCIAGAPTQTAAAGSVAQQNSQIPVPYGNINNQNRKLILKFTGTTDSSSNQYWDSIVPNLQGTVLQSFSTAVASGTYGAESVIGGPSDSTGLAGGFVNVKAIIDKITVSVPWNAQGIALDFRYLAAAGVPNASYQAFAAVNLGGATLGGPYLSNNATNGQSVALYMPLVNANADSVVGSFTAECVAYGFAGGDHLNCTRLSLIYTGVAAVYIPFGGAAIHGAWIGMLTVEAYKGDIILSGGSGLYPLNVGILNVEVKLGSGYDVNDSGNSFSGTLNWACADRTAPDINGAGNMEILNQRMKPRGFVTGGAISVPSVPASTTAQLNPFWRHAWVSVHTGGGVTVSVIAVDGGTTGLTVAASSSTAVRVPSGKTITLTYSGGTPTWDWWLD